MDSRDELATPALPEVREADCNNEKSLETFPKRDDKGLQHSETAHKDEIKSQDGPV